MNKTSKPRPRKEVNREQHGRSGPDRESILHFSLFVNNDDAQGPEPVTLKALCGPGDTFEPVLIVMLTRED